MKRKFIGERGIISSSEVSQHRHVLYSLDEAFEIFHSCKERTRIKIGTINGYQEVMRYIRQLLSGDVMDVIETTADKIRSYINYLRTERIPYSEDEHRKRSNKELSVHMINIRIRALSTFRFLFTEKMISLGGGLTFEEALSKKIMIFFTEWNVYMTMNSSLSNTPF